MVMGESKLRVNQFSPKKVMHNKFIHKQKTLECAQQHFETQISFQIKINLDPTVR
jgi:hypothetical protein